MPKWTEYTSKDTLADNDEVMLYDATARANKRGLMSKFWDYVVDKMATAMISKLETNNKTIIGAINALNSDSPIRYIIVGSGGNNPAKTIKENYQKMPTGITFGTILDGMQFVYFGCKTNNNYGSYMVCAYDGVQRLIYIDKGNVLEKTLS